MPEPSKPLVTLDNMRPIKEIARMLGISEKTAKRWIQEGTLQAVRIGGPNGRVMSSIEAAENRNTFERNRPRHWAGPFHWIQARYEYACRPAGLLSIPPASA